MIIDRILFDYVRVLCSMYGIGEGDRVIGLPSSGREIFVEAPGSRIIGLDRSWARFVLTRIDDD